MDNEKVNEELTKFENEKIRLITGLQEAEDALAKHDQVRQDIIGRKRHIDAQLVQINIKISQYRRNFKMDGYKTSKLRKTTSAQKKSLIELRGGKCQECGTIENLTEHHIVPLSHGGDDTDANKLILCIDCHTRKHRV